MQQDSSCHCSDASRFDDLGDARDLYCRIPVGVLESAASASPTCALSAIWTARLCTLACIFARRLADILACVCWFSLPRGSFGDHYLFCDAVTGESRSGATEDGMREGGTRCPQRVGEVTAALPLDVHAFGDFFGIVFGEVDPPLTLERGARAFANQNASIKVLRFKGVYAFITSTPHRFFHVSRQRDASPLGCCRRGISYRRCANGLHLGRAGIEEKTASR
jgi:hypothetical protein